jgi:predicted ATPase
MSLSAGTTTEHSQRSEIAGISVSGYKSIGDEQEIEVRPLTILAGANSSGKSSMMQPLLLLKQTLEASYDPGPLLINGPNVRFTSVDQFMSALRGKRTAQFSVALRRENGSVVKTSFRKGMKQPLEVVETSITGSAGACTLRPDTPASELLTAIPSGARDVLGEAFNGWCERAQVSVERNRSFLKATLRVSPMLTVYTFDPAAEIEQHVREFIHLPGLRGNPERTYPVSAVGRAFPGTFEKYVASIVAQWGADERKQAKLAALSADLEKLGLTWKVAAKRISDTEVELSVGRLPHAERGGAYDVVSIADVGFGVSQVLPLIIALHAAHPGQLVYVEQPELHLHPRAQQALAEVLAGAADRNVRVIAETHSATMLLAIQSLVAEGRLEPGKVKLHWFQRGADGATQITSADLDQKGAFGDWPEDFGEVALEAESRYLDAVEGRHEGQ